MTPEDIVSRVARSQELIEFATTPGRALILIGQLQLALRHPENRGPSTEIVREMIRNMAHGIATVTDTPEVIEVIATGDHPEFDMTDAEADEYFGQRPRPERQLNLAIDLAEDCNLEEVGKALGMLMQQTPDPQATFEQWQEALGRAKIEPIFPA